MAPRGLTNFVIGGGTDASRPPSAASMRRAAVAANAKVPIKQTTLQQEQAEQHSVDCNQFGGNSGFRIAGAQANEGQRRNSVESVNGGHDRYGTEAGSIDTTINTSGLESQYHQQAQSQYHTRDEVQEEGLEDSDDEGQSESQSDEAEEESDGVNMLEQGEEEPIPDKFLDEARQYMQNGQYNPRLLEPPLFDSNSYPSTTSGVPEDNMDVDTIVQHPTHRTDQAHTSNIPTRGIGRPQNVQEAHPLQQPNQKVVPVRSDHLQPASQVLQQSIYQKSAAVRDNQRANASLALQGASSHHNVAAANVSKQAPSHERLHLRASNYMQAAQPPDLSAATSSLPQRGSRTVISAYRKPDIRQSAQNIAGPHAAQELDEELASHNNAVEGPSAKESVQPVEDYNQPELFRMTYDQLRNESFDDVPRGKNVVLAPDMQQRSIAERLEYVQKNVAPEDQTKFFGALPTREWEEAGDWFLDRFSDIINRAKEARQHKRKLAKEFEDQVEQRYRQVAKRQHGVEAALNQMKTHGQGLLPSPRASKSPQPTKRTKSSQ